MNISQQVLSIFLFLCMPRHSHKMGLHYVITRQYQLVQVQPVKRSIRLLVLARSAEQADVGNVGLATFAATSSTIESGCGIFK